MTPRRQELLEGRCCANCAYFEWEYEDGYCHRRKGRTVNYWDLCRLFKRR